MSQIFYPALNDLGDRKKGDPVPLEIPVDAGQISDGYHTFDELYEHRCLLFCALLRIGVAYQKELSLAKGFGTTAWRSHHHSDGSALDGWFIAGLKLNPVGEITYHLPDKMWDLLEGVPVFDQAPKWDGHTSNDVLDRLREWLVFTL